MASDFNLGEDENGSEAVCVSAWVTRSHLPPPTPLPTPEVNRRRAENSMMETGPRPTGDGGFSGLASIKVGSTC